MGILVQFGESFSCMFGVMRLEYGERTIHEFENGSDTLLSVDNGAHVLIVDKVLSEQHLGHGLAPQYGVDEKRFCCPSPDATTLELG